MIAGIRNVLAIALVGALLAPPAGFAQQSILVRAGKVIE
jgi:hypothetical protein